MPIAIPGGYINHCPKTGGTTIYEILRCLGIPFSIAGLGGHHALCNVPDVDPSLPAFCMIRHPVQYLQSVWMYARNVDRQPRDFNAPDIIKLFAASRDTSWSEFVAYATGEIPGCCYRIFDLYTRGISHVGLTRRMRADFSIFLHHCGYKSARPSAFRFKANAAKPQDKELCRPSENELGAIMAAEQACFDRWEF